ncbi:cation:proton antiporter [Ilumatobacter sp.]|uniref:cation:proton antiporter n=1 Tax=Ilumatobacter sp. TaxID=1967498 RepID=UPI003AF59BB3
MLSGWDVVIIGSALLVYAFASGRLAGSPLTPAMVFVAIGYLVGADGLDLLAVEIDSADLRLLAEVTLALLLFSDAAALNTRRLVRETVLPARLLGVALPLTIVVGAVVAIAAFPDLGVFEAAALAVLLAPTDAALGQTVVSDIRLPPVLRQGLNVESGLNDGVCVPLLVAALAFAELEEAPTFDGGVLVDLVEELFVAVVVGAVVAAVVGLLARTSARRGWMQPGWGQVVPLVAAVIAYVVTVEIGGSGFIAAFVAGIVYGRLLGADAHRTTEFTEQLGGILSAVTFLLFGAVMVAISLPDIDLRTVGYAVASLTLIRMVPVWLSLLGSGAAWQTSAFAGWFGPRGLATIVFALTVVEDSGVPGTSRIVDVATVTVLFSVFAHGLSAPVLTDRYVRWFTANEASLGLESDAVDVGSPHRRRPRWMHLPENEPVDLPSD